MNFTLLIDNAPSPSQDLSSEHGLSLFCRLDSMGILIDTGMTGMAMVNAELLGIDISDIDVLVLSHGHNDHTGGLERFMQLNSKATIYSSPLIARCQYESKRHGILHDISPDRHTIEKNIGRFRFVDSNMTISDGITLFFPQYDGFALPAGNRYLSVREDKSCGDYKANDEIAIAVKERDKVAVISPCSHSGLLNTLHSAEMLSGISSENIKAYIGGLHLIDEEYENDNVESLALDFRMKYPGTTLYSCHCTGEKACKCLKSVLDDRFIRFHTGYTFTI